MSVRSRQLAYVFDEGGEDTMTAAVRGSKGLGLAQLTQMGLPVPYGFTIPTGVCRAYLEHGKLPNRFDWHLERCLSMLEKRSGKRLGDQSAPLLLSVRSGAADSMPGMMDTILNVGYCERTHKGLAKIGGETFADDCGKRMQDSFASQMTASFMSDDFDGCSCATCKVERARARESARKAMDELKDPRSQILTALWLVFKSWKSQRARAYRKAQGIAEWAGTAATVQEMVFGNMGYDSCTGVVFSRDARTGAFGLYGEFLPQAQGEDVVAGVRTPEPIHKMKEWNEGVYRELREHVQRLDRHFGDIVDVEFTVERGTLFLLQCRKAKRTAQAAATYAVHQVWSGAWDRRTAVKSLSHEQIRELSRKTFEPAAFEKAVEDRLFVQGLPASPGSVTGHPVFSSKEAVDIAARGEPVVLFRPETSPDDLKGMLVAAAFVTATGGATSHAAVVARSLNKPAVVGCPITIWDDSATNEQGVDVIRLGVVSVNGASGHVIHGEIAQCDAKEWGEVANLLRWHRQYLPVSRRVPPRLRLELINTRVCGNTLLNDFYMSDAMAVAAAGTKLGNQARMLRDRLHVETAEFLACYMLLAVAGESRYATHKNVFTRLMATDSCRDAWQELKEKYGYGSIDAANKRRVAQQQALEALRNKELSEPAYFLELCAAVFDEASAWKLTSVGGALWAAIARAPMRFLRGEIDHTTFADHAFNLRHNGGRLFDKHPMVSELTVNGILDSQLDSKKNAWSVGSLYEGLMYYHDKLSPEVARLWTDGVHAGLWRPGKV